MNKCIRVKSIQLGNYARKNNVSSISEQDRDLQPNKNSDRMMSPNFYINKQRCTKLQNKKNVFFSSLNERIYKSIIYAANI